MDFESQNFDSDVNDGNNRTPQRGDSLFFVSHLQGNTPESEKERIRFTDLMIGKPDSDYLFLHIAPRTVV